MKAALHEALAAEDGYEALSALLRYISATHEQLGTRRFETALMTAAGKEEEKAMTTLLEKFWLEGEQRGAKKSERVGRAKALLELLAAKFGALPDEVEEKVMAADEATLSRWSVRVLTETTIAGVLDDAKPRRTKRASARA
jgi:hypothetical protein